MKFLGLRFGVTSSSNTASCPSACYHFHSQSDSFYYDSYSQCSQYQTMIFRLLLYGFMWFIGSSYFCSYYYYVFLGSIQYPFLFIEVDVVGCGSGYWWSADLTSSIILNSHAFRSITNNSGYFVGLALHMMTSYLDSSHNFAG